MGGAVKSFFARVMPKLLFTPMRKINGSLDVTVQYMAAATEWIRNLLQTTKKNTIALCPFQFDLCFAVGNPLVLDDQFEADDDDDDPNDKDESKEDDQYVDYIGQIEDKLKANELANSKMKKPAEQARDGVGRVFLDLYKQFLQENERQPQDDNNFSNLHRRRMVAMVDRRAQNEQSDDPIFLYDPPEDALTVPQQPVPEWFVTSSRMSLLPDLKYGMDKKEDDDEDADDKDPAKKEPSKYRNIGANFSCSSALLTLSFHVKNENVIKLYLYHNGQSIRFMPGDIKVILPLLFNMKYGDNATWIEAEHEYGPDSYIKVMEDILKDEEFEAFQQSYQ